MKSALRVLTALSERKEPLQADLDELHWYAPSESPRPVDELVCDAIQRALKDREQSRKAVKEQLREQVLALQFSGDDRSLHPAAPGDDRRQQHLALSAKLRQLGDALQQAADNIVAEEVDLPSIMQLLNEHARLTRQLLAGEPAVQQRPK